MAANIVRSISGVRDMSRARRVTITLSDDLLAVLDGIKKPEGYRALRDESREDARLSFPAQAEVILRDEP